jgi:hypothetical protein
MRWNGGDSIISFSDTIFDDATVQGNSFGNFQLASSIFRGGGTYKFGNTIYSTIGPLSMTDIIMDGGNLQLPQNDLDNCYISNVELNRSTLMSVTELIGMTITDLEITGQCTVHIEMSNSTISHSSINNSNVSMSGASSTLTLCNFNKTGSINLSVNYATVTGNTFLAGSVLTCNLMGPGNCILSNCQLFNSHLAIIANDSVISNCQYTDTETIGFNLINATITNTTFLANTTATCTLTGQNTFQMSSMISNCQFSQNNNLNISIIGTNSSPGLINNLTAFGSTLNLNLTEASFISSSFQNFSSAALNLTGSTISNLYATDCTLTSDNTAYFTGQSGTKNVYQGQGNTFWFSYYDNTGAAQRTPIT